MAHSPQIHPAPPSGTNNCRIRELTGAEGEAILDAEYASAAAPSAAIELASCADTTTTFGGLIALQNLLNESKTPPAVVSISYGECEAYNGVSSNAAYSSAYQQAVTEGVSVFVSAGDEGAASCERRRILRHARYRSTVPLRRLPITSPWAAPISATVTPAPTTRTGIPPTRSTYESAQVLYSRNSLERFLRQRVDRNGRRL